jgi:NNP family nitrate/nitrite transporter-like MFS transporter
MNDQNRVLALSTSAFTLLFAVWLMLGVLGVSIKRELGLSSIQFTWLVSIAVLSGSLLRLPFGVITDRIGGRRMMTLTLLLTAIPSYLVARAHSFGDVLLYTFLFGIAGNAFAVGIAWNAAWFDRERQGLALGTFGAGNVGASATKLIGPALIALVPAFGWRFVPMLYAGLLVLMAAAVWLFTPSVDRMPGAGRSMASLLLPLREVRVWRFGLYYVLVFGAYVALSLWLPNYYAVVYGLPLSKAALLTALFIFPASLLRPVGGWLSDRYGARAVTYSVFIAMLVACVPLALPQGAFGLRLGLWPFFALVEIFGIGMGLGKASIYKYIPEYFPKDVGLVGGLVGTLGALGGFFLPLAFGYIDAWSGRPESCFWVMFALVLWSLSWLHLVVTGIKRETQHARLVAALSTKS